MLFDSHVHFDRFVKEGSLSELLKRTQSAKVLEMIAIGGSADANELSIQLAQDHPGCIYGCVGFDRDEALNEFDLELFRSQLSNPLVRAVGEMGLDYFYSKETATEQKKLFETNLELALECRKPVVVHSRDADEDTLGILTDFANAWKGRFDALGVLHCFTREKEMACSLLDLGFMISFSGIVTFTNADSLRAVVPYVPDDRLLIETDSPYLAPVPERGKRNEPAFVFHVLKQLAELRADSVESLANLTTKNAHHLFAL